MKDHLVTRRALIALPVLIFVAPALARGRGGGRSGGRSFGGRGGRGGFGSLGAWFVLLVPVAIFIIYLLRTEKPSPKPVIPAKRLGARPACAYFVEATWFAAWPAEVSTKETLSTAALTTHAARAYA